MKGVHFMHVFFNAVGQIRPRTASAGEARTDLLQIEDRNYPQFVLAVRGPVFVLERLYE
jgi:hypothetical protein